MGTSRAGRKAILRGDSALPGAIARLFEPLVAPASTIADVAQMVLEEALQLTTSRHGFVSTIDPRTGDNLGHTLTSMLAGQCQIAPGRRKVVFSRGADGRYPGLWGHALNTRQGFFVNHPAHHPAAAGTPHGHLPIERFLSVPVMLKNEVVGQIALANPAQDYTERDLRAVVGLGGCFALAIQRLRFEEALEEERDFAAAVLETAGALVVVLDTQGRILRFNRACERTTGYRFEEVQGRPLWDFLVAAQDVAPVKAVFAQLAAGHFPNEHENDWVTKTGERRRIAWSNTCLLGPEGHVSFVIATGLDVTERRQAKAAARRADEQRRLALEAGNLGTWDYHFASGEVFWDERCRKLFGVAQGDRIDYGKAIAIMYEADRERVDAAVQAALAPGSTGEYAAEYRVVWPDGSVRWVSAKGRVYFEEEGGQRKPERFIGTVLDITESKHAEEALRESEALYRAIGESIDYGVWVCAPDGRNTYASESFLKLVGMTQEQCSNFGWGAVLHPDDAERTIAAWKDCVRTGGMWDIEHRFRGVDGQYHPVLARGVPVRNDRGEIVCWAGINLDISRLKLAEQKLRESQEDLRRAQAVAQVGSWRLNVQRNELLWSEETFRIFGVPRGTPLSYETFLSFVHPEDREHVDRRWKAAVHGEPYDIEHRIIAGGAVKWVRELAVLEVDSQGTLLGGFGTVQDITERKQAEAALAQAHASLEEKVRKRTARIRQSSRRLAAEIRVRRQTERQIKEAEFRYRTVADFTYDWEYWKSPQGTLIYCSPSCGRVTGYTAEEMMADPQLLLRIMLPEDRPVWDEHEAVARTRRDVCSIQFRIRHKDGGLRWLDHNCRTITGNGGEFLGIRASNRDVTERNHAEMEMQRLREEVSRFSRITAAGQLTASIAHELNQPLGAILCNAQAAVTQLDQRPISADEVRAALEDILDDCRRAGAVIQRLRSWYEKGTHELGPVQLNDVIRETLALLRGEFVFKDINLHLQLDPRLCRVRGNRVELQQVILNLVLNALEALTARDTGARRLSLRTWREKPDTVRAAISDSGPGLTPEQLSRVFEPFYTTKDRGTGMGLAISHSILEGHLGKLWADNNPAGGATFHLALPALSEGTT